MDVIVCDHHQVAQTRPPALAVINPIEPDAGFPFSGLCGAGVAFYLALGVRMRLRERGGPVPDLRRSSTWWRSGTHRRPRAGGRGEPRAGEVRPARAGQPATQPGIVALKRVSGRVADVDSGAVGFRLAPRLNAGGRLADATRSLDLLTTDGCRRGRAAWRWPSTRRTAPARRSSARWSTRPSAMIEDAGGLGDRRGIVLASPAFHPGVVGIVASRIVERYYRPTVLIAAERGRARPRLGAQHRRRRPLRRAGRVPRSPRALRRPPHGGGAHHPPRSRRRSWRRGSMPRSRRARSPRTSCRRCASIASCALRRRRSRRVSPIWRAWSPSVRATPKPVFLARNVRVRDRRIVGEHHLKLVLEQDGRTMPGDRLRHGRSVGGGRATSSTCSSASCRTNGMAMYPRS